MRYREEYAQTTAAGCSRDPASHRGPGDRGHQDIQDQLGPASPQRYSLSCYFAIVGALRTAGHEVITVAELSPGGDHLRPLRKEIGRGGGAKNVRHFSSE